MDFLDKEHCVFGEVVEGHDALLNINEAICDENHVPYQDIRYIFSCLLHAIKVFMKIIPKPYCMSNRITHTVILDDPFPDPPGLEFPIHSPEPSKEMLDVRYISSSLICKSDFLMVLSFCR